MLKRVSWCTLLWVYFTLVGSTPSIILPYPFPPHHHFSTAFSTHYSTIYLHRCYVLWCHWCSVILFSFPSFPHRVVPLLQTCSTYQCVYDHVCFCVSHMRENMQALCFWAWLTSLNMISSNCIHLPSNHVVSLLKANFKNIPTPTVEEWMRGEKPRMPARHWGASTRCTSQMGVPGKRPSKFSFPALGF
jgi:hypothetical protein